MILIKNHTQNPFFNIATEEVLLKNTNEDIIFFYRNAPSVIIGKHQLHNLEVNIPYTVQNKIPVIRRISGGGTVYHDENNLNYCIISSKEKAWVDFEIFTQPLIQLLKKMGLSPELRSKSDIRLERLKISGNASHILKNRVLHHGSILFNTDLQRLTKTLKNAPSRYKTRTVHSRRSLVTNIAQHLTKNISVTDFQELFITELRKSGTISSERELTAEEKCNINELVETKYKTVEWNVLYNANYEFHNTFLYNGALHTINFKTTKGFCETEFSNLTKGTNTQQIIKNVPHETSVFLEQLSAHYPPEIILKEFF